MPDRWYEEARKLIEDAYSEYVIRGGDRERLLVASALRAAYREGARAAMEIVEDAWDRGIGSVHSAAGDRVRKEVLGEDDH